MFGNGNGISVGSDGISWGDFSYAWGDDEVETYEDPDDDRIVELLPADGDWLGISPWLLFGFAGIAYLLLRKK